MRLLVNGLCWLTIAALAWLCAMSVILHHPGLGRRLGMIALFALQSLLAMAVTSHWLSGLWWRVAALAGAAAAARALRVRACRRLLRVAF